MRTIHLASELGTAQKVCVAIGFFDGVHLGHQQIIRQTIADARQHEAVALVITFDCHPNTIVAPNRVPPLIYSLPQKLRTIESLGADTLLLIHFDKPFSEQPAEAFVRGLARDLGRIQSLCVGANFTFGHKRRGNVALLKQLGQESGFTTHALAAVSLDGKIISSTRIRDTIASGQLDLAGQMLGRQYSIAGPIVRGDRLGTPLGFPTANLNTTGLQLPPTGVYVAHATTAGKTRRAVVNIGRRPTVAPTDAPIRVEAHLLDTEAEFYGQEMELAFVDKLRAEKKFASLDELRAQIGNDIAEARKRF